MKSILLSVVLFLAAVGNVQSRDVKFSIITFGKKASVTIPALKQTVDLKPHLVYDGVQTGYVNGCPDEEFEYSYTIDGQPEPGINSRKLPVGQTTTYNELVGRLETVSKMKGMGYPQDQEWNRTGEDKVELFDDSYIPTVVIDNSNAKEYFTSPYSFGTKDEKTKVPLKKIIFILKETVFADTNIQTAQKSRYNDKIQFKVKLNEKLCKRKSLKFRAAGAEDPSYLGESIYSDLAQTIGNPVHDKIFARVYLIDGTPIGLYNIIDVTASSAFLKSEFYGDVKGKDNKDQKQVGAIFECHSSDFEKGMACENKKVEKDPKKKEEKKDEYTKKDEELDKKKVEALIEAMDKVNVKDEASVKEFSEKWLDLDTLFKALSLEYLCGHWDSYWEYSDTVEFPSKRKRQEKPTKQLPHGPAPKPNTPQKPAVSPAPKQVVKRTVNKPTNYVLYQDPRLSTENNYKFYFIDQDFDQTFGVGKDVCGPSCSYKELIANHRVRISTLFLQEGSVSRKMFEEHLKSIVQHAYNPVALGRRIDEYERRYGPEIEWDFNEATFRNRKDRDSTNRNSSHTNKNISYKDHKKGLEDLRKYIETRAKTVTKDLDFEWDKVAMDPIEREVIIESEEKQKLEFEKSDAPMNKIISTSTILAIAIVIFLQLFI